MVGAPDPVGAGAMYGAEETTGSAIEVVEGQADERQDRVPEWKLLVHTPAVFVRVATAGLTGYGTWKNVRRMGCKRVGRWGKARERGWAAANTGENSTPYLRC